MGKNKLIILLLIFVNLSCVFNKEKKFIFYSDEKIIELKNYNIYNSYGVIFVSVDEEFYKKNLLNKKVDSVFYVTQDTIVKACMIKNSWREKFCNFNIGVNFNNELKVDYYEKNKEFRFLIGQENKVHYIIKDEKVKIHKIENLNL